MNNLNKEIKYYTSNGIKEKLAVYKYLLNI
jgi:hypothetical protein